MEPEKKGGEVNVGSIKMPYYYYDNGHGVLDDKHLISVDKNAQENEIDTRSRILSCSLEHCTLLRCYGKSEANGDVVYERYTESLSAFIKHDDSPPLVQPFKVPAADSCPEDKKLTYLNIPDLYKQMMRDAIKFIVYLHDVNNESLSHLALRRNFVVKGSSLKMWRLRYNGVRSTTEASRNNDFKLMASVFREMFDGVSVPFDFEHLLQCMDNYEESRGDRVLVLNHLAVLGCEERRLRIQDLRDKSFYLSTTHGQIYGGLFSSMISDGEDWTLNLSRPEYGILEAMFVSSKATYNFRRMNNNQIRAASLNFNAIKFCRDVLEHINDKDPKNKVLEQYNNGEPFCAHEMVCIILAVFAKQLVNFQMEASDKGVLEYLINL